MRDQERKVSISNSMLRSRIPKGAHHIKYDDKFIDTTPYKGTFFFLFGVELRERERTNYREDDPH